MKKWFKNGDGDLKEMNLGKILKIKFLNHIMQKSLRLERSIHNVFTNVFLECV